MPLGKNWYLQTSNVQWAPWRLRSNEMLPCNDVIICLRGIPWIRHTDRREWATLAKPCAFGITSIIKKCRLWLQHDTRIFWQHKVSRTYHLRDMMQMTHILVCWHCHLSFWYHCYYSYYFFIDLICVFFSFSFCFHHSCYLLFAIIIFCSYCLHCCCNNFNHCLFFWLALSYSMTKIFTLS